MDVVTADQAKIAEDEGAVLIAGASSGLGAGMARVWTRRGPGSDRAARRHRTGRGSRCAITRRRAGPLFRHRGRGGAVAGIRWVRGERATLHGPGDFAEVVHVFALRRAVSRNTPIRSPGPVSAVCAVVLCDARVAAGCRSVW
jgi:hypothetical protein